MSGSLKIGFVGVALLATSFSLGCRDKQPDSPPPPGPQENFEMSMRTLEGTLPAPPDEIARVTEALFRKMGLVSVNRYTSPVWSAVVSGKKPSAMGSQYVLNVRKGEEQSYNSFLTISVGMTGDETESRWLVGEICKELNIVSPPPPPAPDPGAAPSEPPPSGA